MAKVNVDPNAAKALAHPVRVRILEQLGTGEMSPTQLARALGSPVPNISYHVRKLEALGVLELSKEVRRRGAIEHYFRAVASVAAGSTDSSRVVWLYRCNPGGDHSRAPWQEVNDDPGHNPDAFDPGEWCEALLLGEPRAVGNVEIEAA